MAALCTVPRHAHAQNLGTATATVTVAKTHTCQTGKVEVWGVERGATYTVNLYNVTECSGDTIQVTLWGTQYSASKMGAGQYSFQFTVPTDANCTTPVMYCGSVHAHSACDSSKQVHIAAVDSSGTIICGNVPPCTPIAAPVLVGCPSNVTVTCYEDVPKAATVTASDDCGPVNVTFNETQTNQGSSCSNTITRTWTATNIIGTVTCTQTITVTGGSGPVATAGQIQPCYKSVSDALEAAKAATSVISACGGATLSASAVGTCPAAITVTATDVCGRQATANYSAKILTALPALTGCPAETVNVSCIGDVPPAATVTAVDSCGATLTVVATETALGTDCNKTITRTWAATDCAGQTATCKQTITVTGPTPDVKKGTIASCYKSLAEADAAALAATSATVGCGGTATLSVSDDGKTCPATITVTGTSTCGSASVTYTAKILTTPPVLTGCPNPTVTVACSKDVPPAATVTAKDACGDTVTVTPSETPTGDNCSGTITRTWTATDCAGNTNSCQQVITIVAGPPNITKGTIASCYKSLADADAAAKAATTATDPCGGAALLSVRDDGKTCPATITVTATSACGVPASVTYTATILTAPPVLTGCPAQTVNVACARDVPAAATVTAKDTCNNVLTVSFDEQKSGSDCSGTITRTWSATDCAGQTSTCQQVVTITPVPPTVTKGTIATCYKTIAEARAAALAATTVTDPCGGTPTKDVADDGQTCTATITVTGKSACEQTASATYTATILSTPPVLTGCPANVGPLTCASQVPDPAAVTAKDACGKSLTVSYNQDVTGTDCSQTITRTWSATDCASQTTTCTQVITVIMPPPTVQCPDAVTGYQACGATGGPATFSATATDSCGASLPVKFYVDYGLATQKEVHSGDTFLVGTTTVTAVATDKCGQTDKCTFTVTIETTTCWNVSALKFYDVDGSGTFDPTIDTLAVGGVNLMLTWVDDRDKSNHCQVLTTGADGTVTFQLPDNAAYTLCEVIPTTGTACKWVQTMPNAATPGSNGSGCYVGVANAALAQTPLQFGNICVCPPLGGLTLGFWSNKNGQSVLQSNDPAWRNVLDGLTLQTPAPYLRNENGSFFTVPTTGAFKDAYGGFRTWLLGARATNMAYMLSAQLAAAQLNVLTLNNNKFGGLSGDTTVYLSADLSACYGSPTARLSEVIAKAIVALQADGNTVAGSPNRATQACLEAILDGFNNNKYPQMSGTACPVVYNPVPKCP